MFDYQVSKHPHFDEACRAFALRHKSSCVLSAWSAKKHPPMSAMKP